ncbi:shikimate dehydrogenase family protein [Salegentibacter sp. HM20]
MKTYGLVGRNIDYSFSRKYFNTKFEREKIPAKYLNFDLASIEEFRKIFEENEAVSGLNVTIPYKQEVISFLNKLADAAAEINAVNTIKIEKDGSLTGYNTDYIGFTEAIRPHLKNVHQNALILGTGGASKAVAYALKKINIGYHFVSRRPGQNIIRYGELDKSHLTDFQIIVNSTPLGTFPKVDACPPIPFENLTENHLVFDLIYNPAETRLMKLAKEKGAQTLNGLRMLELQAEAAWEIWQK